MLMVSMFKVESGARAGLMREPAGIPDEDDVLRAGPFPFDASLKMKVVKEAVGSRCLTGKVVTQP